MKKKKKTNHPLQVDDSFEVETIDSKAKISSTRKEHNPFFSPTGKVDWKALYDYIRSQHAGDFHSATCEHSFYIDPSDSGCG